MRHVAWLVWLGLVAVSSAHAQTDPATEGTTEEPATTPDAVPAEAPAEGSAALAPPAPAPPPVEEVPAEAPAQQVDTQPATEPEPEPAPTTVSEEAADDLADVDSPEGEEEKLRWAGTTLTMDHTVSTNTFVKSSQLSYNPTYVIGFILRPRWALNDHMYLGLRQDFDVEMTQSDDRPRERQLFFYDTRFIFGYSEFATLWGIAFSGTADIRLPTSQSSQALSRLFATGFSLTASRPVEGVLAGLSFDALFSYVRNWATSNVASSDNAYPCSVIDTAGGIHRSCDQDGGPSATRDSFTLGVSGTLSPIENLSTTLEFNWAWRLAYGLGDAVVPTATGTTTIPDLSDTHWRNTTVFGADVTYAFAKWISASFSMSTDTSQLNGSGSRRNPIYNNDTTLSLSADLVIDELYLAIRGRRAQRAAERQAESERAQRSSARSGF